MKEFIEKLISRLEKCIFSKSEILEYNTENQKHLISRNKGIKCAIKIVNELAEEYENDFCEWKMFKANARLRHKNCMFAEDTVDPWKFNFCPYCGKKIKVVE